MRPELVPANRRSPPFGLALERTEPGELVEPGQDVEGAFGSEGPDQLVLEVAVADEDLGQGRACPLHEPSFAQVAQPQHHCLRVGGRQLCDVPPDVRDATHVDDPHPLREPTVLREGGESSHVALTFHQDDRAHRGRRPQPSTPVAS